jgi:arginine/lysine/ornithine decarboxylase
MNTPIFDFVNEYKNRSAARLHMPGHKGIGPLGVEALDITEISGADVLYSARGIIKKSEENTSLLFGTKKTFYSTEGSTLCIKAILFLLKLYCADRNKKPLVLAARNAHKSFITAAAINDIEVKWLYSKDNSLLSCKIDLNALEKMLKAEKPAAFYITSPDYLGNVLDIKAIADLCHKYNTVLAVDNAHGAYLKFLPKSMHPMDLGADLCTDSAHKTLPVLTGGAYLHISKSADSIFGEYAQNALSVFASTSPSYLILQSLDMANKLIDDGFFKKLKSVCKEVESLKNSLTKLGFDILGNEPLKITIATKSYGYLGTQLADILERQNIIPEFSDPDFLVLMFSANTPKSDVEKLKAALEQAERKVPITEKPPVPKMGRQCLSPREALFSAYEITKVENSKDKILAAVNVGCPPAIPIAICGEKIDENTVKCFEYYDIKEIFTVK